VKADAEFPERSGYNEFRQSGGLEVAKKKVIPQKFQVWLEARKRFLLTDAQVQMARELGLNPNKLGKLANEKQEIRQQSLSEYIDEIYFKRFGRNEPEVVRSLEDLIQAQREKKVERDVRRAQSEDGPAEEESNSTTMEG
jgi:hypothetical protein